MNDKTLNNYINMNSEDRLNEFMSTLSKTNRTPDYFVNWDKVRNRTRAYELELNTLNYLIGKENIREVACELFTNQPNLLKAIPVLIASRDNKIDVLSVDDLDFSVNTLDFKNPDMEKLEEYLDFIEDSGLFKFLQKTMQRNLVDFVYGVETGLDSNARKNRSGDTMENIVAYFIENTISNYSDRFYLYKQATAKSIKENCNIIVPVDKSARRFDLALYDSLKKHLYLIETNYYGGGGSKLKAVAGEFSELDSFLSTNKNLTFIWISDGQGWHSARLPLLEAFYRIKYIFNLEMLRNGFMKDLIFDL